MSGGKLFDSVILGTLPIKRKRDPEQKKDKGKEEEEKEGKEEKEEKEGKKQKLIITKEIIELKEPKEKKSKKIELPDLLLWSDEYAASVGAWFRGRGNILLITGPLGSGKRTFIRTNIPNLIEFSKDCAGDVEKFNELASHGSRESVIGPGGRCAVKTTIFLLDGYDTLHPKKFSRVLSDKKVRLICTAKNLSQKHVRELKGGPGVQCITLPVIQRSKLSEIAKLWRAPILPTVRKMRLYGEWLYGGWLCRTHAWLVEQQSMETDNIFEKGKDLMRGYTDPAKAIELYTTDSRLRHMMYQPEFSELFRTADKMRQLFATKLAELVECYVAPNSIKKISRPLVYPRVYENIRTIKMTLEEEDGEDPVKRMINYCVLKNSACLMGGSSASIYSLNPPVKI